MLGKQYPRIACAIASEQTRLLWAVATEVEEPQRFAGCGDRAVLAAAHGSIVYVPIRDVEARIPQHIVLEQGGNLVDPPLVGEQLGLRSDNRVVPEPLRPEVEELPRARV